MHLDEADWTILRTLWREDTHLYPTGPLRLPLNDLSRRTGLHRNTVRTRVTEMRDQEVLLGALVEPRPDLVGCGRAGFVFEIAPPSDLAARLAPRQNVSSVNPGDDVTFTHFWFDLNEGADAVARSIAAVLGATSFHKSYASTDFKPQPATALSALDWRIVQALRHDAWRPLAEIASELKAKKRTVERHTRSLVESGAIIVTPQVRFANIEGWNVVTFVASRADDRTREALRAAFPGRLMGPYKAGKPAVTIPYRNLAHAEAARTQAEPTTGPLTRVVVIDAYRPAGFSAWLDTRVAVAQSRVASAKVAAAGLAGQ